MNVQRNYLANLYKKKAAVEDMAHKNIYFYE